MKKLQYKEIEKLIDILNQIHEHIVEIMNSWQSFTCLEGLYSVKAMLLAIWKLCNDYQIDFKISSLPSLNFSDDDEEWDDIVEAQYKLCDEMEMFTFPGEEFMLKYGWDEIILSNEGELEYCNEDPKYLESALEIHFGDVANILPNAKGFLQEVISGGFFAHNARIMTNTKVGMFMEFADENSHVKKTKLYEHIKHCTYEIIVPFIWHYEFDCHAVKNGCLYAFTTGGGYDYSEEFISPIHGKVFRCILVGILDQLLEIAEEQYGYSIANNLKVAKLG